MRVVRARQLQACSAPHLLEEGTRPNGVGLAGVALHIHGDVKGARLRALGDGHALGGSGCCAARPWGVKGVNARPRSGACFDV